MNDSADGNTFADGDTRSAVLCIGESLYSLSIVILLRKALAAGSSELRFIVDLE
jgi:hypothetical protein